MRPRTRGGCFNVVGAFLCAAVLSACVTRQAAPPGQVPPARVLPSPLHGRAFEVVPAESRLIVLVYRAGPLAALGHTHVVSCRCLIGKVYVPRDPLRASFDLRLPVTQFTVDDPALRAAEHSADFPPDVPQTARDATRHNMLSAALLNVVKYPDITLRSAGLRSSPGGRRGDVVVEVLVEVDGETHSIAVPTHYDIRVDEILVTGKFPLKQTDLGLTPISVAGGAVRVRDGLMVRIRFVARPGIFQVPRNSAANTRTSSAAGRVRASGAPCPAHCAP